MYSHRSRRINMAKRGKIRRRLTVAFYGPQQTSQKTMAVEKAGQKWKKLQQRLRAATILGISFRLLNPCFREIELIRASVLGDSLLICGAV